MANSITNAFSSFNNIMQRELALLQVNMLETSHSATAAATATATAPATAPAPAPATATATAPVLSINLNTLIDKKIAELEERIMSKMTTMCQIRTVTCALSNTVENIDTKIKAIEEQIAEISTEPVSEPKVEEEAEVEKEEETAIESESPEEEEAASESESQEEEAEELTEFRYKGKTYFMDSQCNVYGLDANGDLIDDPIGSYDETTRKITFNN